jgi:hypothetical protein
LKTFFIINLDKKYKISDKEGECESLENKLLMCMIAEKRLQSLETDLMDCYKQYILSKKELTEFKEKTKSP